MTTMGYTRAARTWPAVILWLCGSAALAGAEPAGKPSATGPAVPPLFAGLFGPGRTLDYQFVYKLQPLDLGDTNKPPPWRKTWRRATCTVSANRKVGPAQVCEVGCRLSTGYRALAEEYDGEKKKPVTSTRLAAGTYIATDKGLWIGPRKCSAACQRKLLKRAPMLSADPKPSEVQKGRYEDGGMRTTIARRRIRLGKKTWADAWCRTTSQQESFSFSVAKQLCFAPKLGLVAAESTEYWGTRHPRGFAAVATQLWLRQP
jgi:hypothetical protein